MNKDFRKKLQAKIASDDELLAHLAQVWQDFQDRILADTPVRLKDCIHLNRRQLVEAAKHARIDMARMSEMHLLDEEKPDNHKYAAFLAKWVAKIRPVLVDDGAEMDTPLYLVNAQFAVWVFRSYLTEDIPEELVEYLTYILHFREERGETLALIAYCCEQMGQLRREAEEASSRAE